MSNLIRLMPIMYVLTPLGEAEAHFLQVPFTNDSYCQWGCFQSETKENWWFDNTLVRLIGSISSRRGDNYTEFYLNDELFAMLTPHILRHTGSPFYNRVKSLTQSPSHATKGG